MKNEDVGFVKEGQRVKVKLAAYPFQKYGMLEGKVMHLSADAAEGNASGRTGSTTDEAQNSTSPYKAIVQLDQQQLTTKQQSFDLTPGMQVVAEINQGKRTVMDYLLSPVTGTVMEAGRER